MGERVKFSEAADTSAGSGDYISAANRFKMKKSSNGQMIHICEEPYRYHRHYVEDAPMNRVYFNCCKPDSDNCPLCTDGNQRTPRYVMNVIEYVYEDGQEKPKAKIKIWDVSAKIIKQLHGIEKEYGNLLNFDLKLVCESEQFQSIQIIVPKENEKVKEKIKKLKDENKLFNLENYSKCMAPAEMKKTLGIDSQVEEDAIDIEDEDEKPKSKKEEKKEEKKKEVVKEQKKKIVEEDDDDIEIESKKESKKSSDDDDLDIVEDKKKKPSEKEVKKKDDDDDDDLDSFFKDDEDDK